MEPSLIGPIALVVGLIVLSAFFSLSETALIASGRIKLSYAAEKGDRGAKRAHDLLEKPAALLATILVGNNLVNVMAAATATEIVGPVYTTVFMTLILVIFGEITPKTLAVHHPELLAARVARPITFFVHLFKPVVWVVNGVIAVLLWPVTRGTRGLERKFSRQELIAAIRLGAREGALEPGEARVTREILALKDVPVRRIMIPLDEVDAIDESSTYEEVMREISQSENTRYPVYRNQPAEMVGLLLAKDLLVHREGAEENWRWYVRPLLRCKSDLEADELLRDMQIRHSHLAAVSDESGRAVGIVTMEDILEEIVGDIQDEYDTEETTLIREQSPGRYMVHGCIEVDDLCKVINIDLGHVDQHVTLAEWFDKRSRAEPAKVRRLKVGTARIMPRGGGRFEIRVKSQALGDQKP
jgi:putative hemolysin